MQKYKTIIPIGILILVLVLIAVFLRQQNYIPDEDLDFYQLLALATGGILLFFRVYVADRSVEIQEKSRLDERFKTGVEFLNEEKTISTHITGLYVMYEVYKKNAEDNTEIMQHICRSIMQDTYKSATKDLKEYKQIKNIAIKVIATEKFYKKAGESVGEKTDISRVNFEDMDLSNFDFTKADLSGVRFNRATITGITLEDAKLPYPLDLSEVYSNVKDSNMKGIVLGSSGKLTGLDFTNSDFSGANFNYGTLEECNFTGCDFTDAIGLTFEELSKVKTLYNCRGIPRGIMKELKAKKPDLFIKP